MPSSNTEVWKLKTSLGRWFRSGQSGRIGARAVVLQFPLVLLSSRAVAGSGFLWQWWDSSVQALARRYWEAGHEASRKKIWYRSQPGQHGSGGSSGGRVLNVAVSWTCWFPDYRTGARGWFADHRRGCSPLGDQFSGVTFYLDWQLLQPFSVLCEPTGDSSCICGSLGLHSFWLGWAGLNSAASSCGYGKLAPVCSVCVQGSRLSG